MKVCPSLDSALEMLAGPEYEQSVESVFVIGGGQVGANPLFSGGPRRTLVWSGLVWCHYRQAVPAWSSWSSSRHLFHLAPAGLAFAASRMPGPALGSHA